MSELNTGDDAPDFIGKDQNGDNVKLSDYNERNSILAEVVIKKKFILFAVEQMKVSSQKELNHIHTIWQIKKTIPFCPSGI